MVYTHDWQSKQLCIKPGELTEPDELDGKALLLGWQIPAIHWAPLTHTSAVPTSELVIVAKMDRCY